MLGTGEGDQRAIPLSSQFRLALRGCTGQVCAVWWACPQSGAVAHHTAQPDSCSQSRMSAPPPIVEHAQSQMHKADQAEPHLVDRPGEGDTHCPLSAPFAPGTDQL